jgi:riboflavin synthase
LLIQGESSVFTGIIEEKGSVVELAPNGRLKVAASRVLQGTKVGDSIAVSGVCLTVVELDDAGFAVDVTPETLRQSALAGLRPGSSVNLERSMGADGRFGGHLVNGHVDGVGTISGMRREANAVIIEVSVPAELSRYTVERGSIALDGISLTLTRATEGRLTVSVIPHTVEQTTLGEARAGARVNIEVDIIAKYVESFAARSKGAGRGGIEQALSQGGFMSPGQET